MLQIPLAVEPNQSFTFDDGESRWSVSIKVANTTMVGDFSLGDQVLISGVRLVADQACIPYSYIALPGNFVFVTNGDEIPWWESFGTSQFLLYQSYGKNNG